MSLSEEDRQAFFRLMDEYFASRPHLLREFHPPPAADVPPAQVSAKKAPPPPPRQASGRSAAMTAQPVESLATSMQQTSVSEPASGPHIPAGLTRGKAIGKINTTSTQSILTSSASLAGQKVMDKAKTQIDYYTGRDRAQDEVAAEPSAPSGPIQPPPQRGPTEHALEGASSGLGEAVALYPFAGSQVGDLAVEQGERITLLEEVTSDWFRARSADGMREGIVPANYIQRS
ncbi:Similar to S.cerevisiae protein LSB1 (Negative regulator of actin nucleation-promoting factor activity) [Malassezia sympodialis ATCC 42132]|uniref:Similar to S.cerevisiae protein LSB1 (Negative regulator of actin nucleation-promoting factor activity) n=1 Tax=Malassezia sympodialis (strain ATCC 42132) TaxID=1230383 RepID=A0A1M8A811_MALS4|nr:Similar to S.cerevisiae protein LSB1 (Negative regulator of actin nucleation-promoting factor activity) [Malassezia sympodialis ATCC 42132]